MLLVMVMLFSLAACGTPATPDASEAPAAENVPMQYIKAEEAKELLNDSGYVFFDIRKAADSSANSIPGALKYDMDAAKEGDAEAGKATMTKATEGLDKKIILVCYSGKRYAQAATNALSAIGHDMSKVFTLEGGFTNWSETYPELTTAAPVELPTLNIGYMYSNHQAPLIIAGSKGDALGNIYLREINPKENYVMVKDGKDIANVNLVHCNNGGDVMNLMVAGDLEMALSSFGLPVTNNDKGATIRVISPIHADGIGLVGSKNLTDVNDWDAFLAYAKDKKEPVKIGYHSPANAPVILFENALTENGVTWTEDPEDTSADILLINLKGTQNLFPALQSGEVEAWVGPSPWPEQALIEDQGKLIIDLKNLPPEGRWTSFPCCVFSATQAALDTNKEEIKAFYDLLTAAAAYANTEKEDAGVIVADWMGVNVEAAKKTMTVFTTEVNDNWLSHLNLVYECMMDQGQISGAYAGKTLDEIKGDIFDLTVSGFEK